MSPIIVKSTRPRQSARRLYRNSSDIAFMDVGTFEWPDDFDFGDPESESDPTAIDEALDAAADLDTSGEWDAAMTAYRGIAQRWPEHEAYVNGCIADIERKRDRASG